MGGGEVVADVVGLWSVDEAVACKRPFDHPTWPRTWHCRSDTWYHSEELAVAAAVGTVARGLAHRGTKVGAGAPLLE